MAVLPLPIPRSVRAAASARWRPRRGTALLPMVLAALLLGGCASAPPSPGPSVSGWTSDGSTCSAPLPDLRAAYNRPYTVHGRTYRPLRDVGDYRADGIASWYGWESGARTAMGTAFKPRAFTAASRVLPLPSCVRVTNLNNGRSVVVLVNDRGPFVAGRVMDLSYEAAKALGVTATGTAPVRIVSYAGSGAASQSMDLAQASQPQTLAGAGAPQQFPSAVIAPAAGEPPPQNYLQAGAFTLQQNAQAELERLAAAGIGPVAIVPGYIRGESFYRVQIGPLQQPVSEDSALRDKLRALGVTSFSVVEQ